jgi:hypothetical protein
MGLHTGPARVAASAAWATIGITADLQGRDTVVFYDKPWLMQPVGAPGAPAADASASEIASAAGHALNNVLAYLYAASSYLDDGEVDAARARSAVEDACRGARALSAALSLLGMTRANVADIPVFSHIVDAPSLGRALDATGEDFAADRGPLDRLKGVYAATLDGDTIGALLLCAAAALRRSGGVSCVLRLAVATIFAPNSVEGALRLELGLRATLPSGAAAPRRSSHCPCELALAHVATILPALDAALVQGDDGAIVLAVDLRPHIDRRGAAGAEQ